MNILLNGETRTLRDGISIFELLHAEGYGGRRVAVEINGEIVPKSQHAARLLAADDRVEVVQAIGGG